MADTNSFEDNLIADMRAHDGKVTSGPLAGHPLLVMVAHGAKTGEPRRAILTFHRDNGDFIVAGTAGGSPTTPAWVHNVREHPQVSVEAQNRTFDATATIEEDDAERERLWREHVRQLPHFAEYPGTARRVIPMVRLRPTDA